MSKLASEFLFWLGMAMVLVIAYTLFINYSAGAICRNYGYEYASVNFPAQVVCIDWPTGEQVKWSDIR
jgi:hypothetical protein